MPLHRKTRYFFRDSPFNKPILILLLFYYYSPSFFSSFIIINYPSPCFSTEKKKNKFIPHLVKPFFFFENPFIL